MKDPINSRVRDARFEIANIRMFSVILESIIIFTLCAIFLSLINVSVAMGIMPAFAYFMLRLAEVVRDKRTIRNIVVKYPTLDERLQTAYDNRTESNIIVERLIKDVSKRMDDMHSSEFMCGKKVFARVLLTVFLLFVLLSIHLVEIQQAGIHFRSDMEKALNDLSGNGDGSGGSDTMSMGGGKDWERGNHSNKKETEKIGGAYGGKAPGFSEGPLAGTGGGTGENENENLYGAPTSARIEGQNVKMEVHPEYGGEVDIEDTRKPSDTRPFEGLDSVDSAASDRSQDPVEYQEVIRSYFEKLSAEGGR